MPATAKNTAKSTTDRREIMHTRFWIQFVTSAPAGAIPLRTFADPEPMVAVRTETDPGDGCLEIVCTDSPKPSWDAGTARIPADELETLLPALIDFAYYENELRKLEQAILPHQSTAEADVALAYHIRESNRSQWDRLYQTIEQLYRLRLQFARIEPHLAAADRSLPMPARKMFNRLLRSAQIELRLEAFSDRLETLEDLYEGAVDRVTDQRNYRKGMLLEVGIILILAAEVLLLLFKHG